MDLRYLTPDFAVAPQIALDEVAEAAKRGFRTLINNRPDEEVDASLSHEAMRAAAAAAGLAYVHLPYYPGELTPNLIEEFETALASAQTPVLAWCRSGTRSSHLWGMSQAGILPLDEIVQNAKNAGYDLAALVPLMRAKAASKTEET